MENSMKNCGKPNLYVECVKIDVKQGSSHVMTQINEFVISFSLLSMKGLGCTEMHSYKRVYVSKCLFIHMTHP